LEAGEIVGAGESRLIGIDFEGHVVFLQQGDETGGLGGVEGAKLVKEGLCVGHGGGVVLRFPSLRPPDPPRKKRGEEWNEKEPVAGAN